MCSWAGGGVSLRKSQLFAVSSLQGTEANLRGQGVGDKPCLLHQPCPGKCLCEDPNVTNSGHHGQVFSQWLTLSMTL